MKRYVSPCEFALIHFALARNEEGFRWLSKASQDRCFELTAINVDPRFDALKGERRFAEIVRAVGLS